MKIINWDQIPYQKALNQQLELVEKVAGGEEEQLILCTHPPVVTLGRSQSSKNDLMGWSGETVEVSRGGRATYHGPSQLLIYPVLDLNKADRPVMKPRDIHSYLRCMEQILVKSLQHFGLKSEAKTVSIEQVGEKPLSLTGVWIGDKKIASIGVAVKKWVTYHGAALNVEDDPRAFQGINPCGFNREVMTSIEREIGEVPSRAELTSQIETWSRHYWG